MLHSDLVLNDSALSSQFTYSLCTQSLPSSSLHSLVCTRPLCTQSLSSITLHSFNVLIVSALSHCTHRLCTLLLHSAAVHPVITHSLCYSTTVFRSMLHPLIVLTHTALGYSTTPHSVIVLSHSAPSLCTLPVCTQSLYSATQPRCHSVMCAQPKGPTALIHLAFADHAVRCCSQILHSRQCIHVAVSYTVHMQVYHTKQYSILQSYSPHMYDLVACDCRVTWSKTLLRPYSTWQAA